MAIKVLKSGVRVEVGVAALKLRPARKVVRSTMLARPPQQVRPKGIHQRRVLPFVAEGLERPVHSSSTRAIIHQARDTAPATVEVLRNTPLTQPAAKQTSSNVGEPSVAVNGDVVFFTGNWYAAVSIDGGATFKYIDPNKMAQRGDPAAVTFCCDQVVNYLPSIDTFVWLLQYGPRDGDNIQRLAFAKTADVVAGKWQIFDITTAALGVPGFFLDFPDLAVGSNFLYVTTNCFAPDGKTVGSAVVRIGIDGIDKGAPSATKFVSMDFFSFRVAQDCADTAYFAAHRDTSTLTVFAWPESAKAPTSTDVPVSRWIGTNGYISRTPDGRRWLDRADPRITGAVLAGDELWFAWSVDAESNHRPKPFVQLARINRSDLTLLENVNLFDTDSAICYAGLATNSRHEVGVSYMIGGAVFPSHVVGFLGANQASVVATRGARSPLADDSGHFDWGDFLTARTVFPARTLFAATGFTLQGTKDGGNVDATPQFVVFGRASDASSATAGSAKVSVASDETAAKGAAVGSGPITDVNKLTTVTSDVAATIKAACGVNPGVQALIAPRIPQPELVTKPGTERWPVKTGQDPDRASVGKNIVNGKNLGAGIVFATVEELISIPRPAGLEDATADPPAFQQKRSQPVETTIWQIEGRVTTLKLEADGDYHLVIQGASGDTMVAEVPTGTPVFVGDSPWLQNIKDARQAVDDKLVHNLSPTDFVLPPGGTKLVPRNALSGDFRATPIASFAMPETFRPEADTDGTQMPAFKTAVPSVPVRITGVGFFDRAHGQTGAAANVIELHPVLKVEWL